MLGLGEKLLQAIGLDFLRPVMCQSLGKMFVKKIDSNCRSSSEAAPKIDIPKH